MTAYVFPGQGSQFPGMGKEFMSSIAAFSLTVIAAGPALDTFGSSLPIAAFKAHCVPARGHPFSAWRQMLASHEVRRSNPFLHFACKIERALREHDEENWHPVAALRLRYFLA